MAEESGRGCSKSVRNPNEDFWRLPGQRVFNIVLRFKNLASPGRIFGILSPA